MDGAYFAGNTWYLNGEDSLGLSYEKEIRANGTTEHKHYLSAAGVVFGIYTQRTGTLNSLPANSASYLHYDHLGSLSVVTNELGAVTERLAYDPWGKRRNIMTAPGTPDTLDALVGKTTDRGFTMHEHLDEVGTIHMNGRIYDPLIARFMSADPTIPDPNALPSFNRYSYVRNNPLNLTDPTGFEDSESSFLSWVYSFVSNLLDKKAGPDGSGNSGSSSGANPNSNNASASGAGGGADANSQPKPADQWDPSPPGSKKTKKKGTNTEPEVVTLNGRDVIKSFVGGIGNSLAGAAVGFANYMIALGDFSGMADPVGPWKPFETKSTLIGEQGKITGDALQGVLGATGIGKSVSDVATKPAIVAESNLTTGYHATSPEAAQAILEGGFRPGTKPGRLGSGGVYVNSTVEGAIAEFEHHNPGVKPSVLSVQYSVGENASAAVSPRSYVDAHPLNVDTISAPSVRAPGTINTNVLNGTAKPIEVVR